MVSMEGNQARRKQRKFTAEFKERAVNLVLKQGMSVADVARDLDVVASGLHQWVRQARTTKAKAPPAR
jgi:transposase